MVKTISGFRGRFLRLGGLVLLISVNTRAAQQICNTAADCQGLRAQVDARLKELQAGQMPTFLDIVKDAGGKVKYMAQGDAVQYCASQGNHLPSARELAQLAMSMGAKGIVDACGSSEPKCYRINATNPDGSQDSFSFSYAGYHRPTGEPGEKWVWSSSVVSNIPDYAFVLVGGYGYVGNYYRNYSSAVRCVSGR